MQGGHVKCTAVPRKHRDQRVCFDFGVSRFKKCTTEKVFDCCAKNEDNFCREDVLDLEPKF